MCLTSSCDLAGDFWSFPRSLTSGALQSKVPSMDTCVFSRVRIFARPTSATFAFPSRPSRMLAVCSRTKLQWLPCSLCKHRMLPYFQVSAGRSDVVHENQMAAADFRSVIKVAGLKWCACRAMLDMWSCSTGLDSWQVTAAHCKLA